MKTLLLFFPLFVLLGLCFMTFISRYPRATDGGMAPNSRESQNPANSRHRKSERR